MSQLSECIGNTYKIIKGYLPRETALDLAEKLRNSNEGDPNGAVGFLTGDYVDFYNNLPDMTAISYENIGYLNKFIGGAKLLPTYNYTRIYKNGTELPKHVDRTACEVSLSIHLDGDAPSKFYVRDKNNRVVGVDLEPGDAIVYDGPNAEHWRDAYEGESYVQTFHHYVFSGGKSEHQAFRNYDSLQDYIKVYKGMVPRKVCGEIVDAITSDEYSSRWKRAEVRDGDTCEDMGRLCDDLGVSPDDSIDPIINKYIRKALVEFCREFAEFKVSRDEGYNCLRYTPGGRYDYHTDQFAEYNREVTIIIQLNEDYEGGALRHCYDKYITHLNMGDICIFPANYMFPHKIEEITSGIRYAIVTWAV